MSSAKPKTIDTESSHALAPGTRVRVVDYKSRDERHAAALLLARSFAASNNLMRYIGNVKRPGVAPPPATTSRAGVAKLPADARSLYYFFSGILTTTVLSGGRAMVVVKPELVSESTAGRDWLVVPAASDQHRRSGEGARQRPNEVGNRESSIEQYERFLVVALWLAPGERPDDLPMILRSKHHKTMTAGGWWPNGWGIGGIMRALKISEEFQVRHKEACQKRGIERTSCWTLEIIGTDPDVGGRGYGGVAIREGLEHIDKQETPSPCILETTESRPKAIYERFGFEETSVLSVGQGAVDKDGFQVSRVESGEPRSELTAWTMLRPARGR